MHATIHAVDFRLGSFGDARPSVHVRFDACERELDRLGAQLDLLQKSVHELQGAIVREAALERRVTREAMSTIEGRVPRSARSGRRTVGLDVARASLAGERAWVFGGALRDRALGIVPDEESGDIDLVVAGNVPATAQRLARATSTTAFPKPEFIGGWQVLSVRDGWNIDLAPLHGSTIAEHLRQVDFTVNAIARPLDGGELIDPTGGLADAAARRLRMVSAHNFDVDPARVLRLARLACQLDLAPEPATCAAAEERAGRLAEIAPERIFDELRRILATRRPLLGLELMDELGATAVVLPEAAADSRGRNCLRALLALEADPAPLGAHAEIVHQLMGQALCDDLTRGQALRLAALLASDPSGETARTAISRLRPSGRLRTHIAAVVRGSARAAALADRADVAPRAIHACLRATEPAQVDAVVLAVALATASRPAPVDESAPSRAPALLTAALNWEADGPQLPLLTSNELAAALKLEPGDALGNLLAELEAAQYAAEITTAEQALAHARTAHGHAVVLSNS